MRKVSAAVVFAIGLSSTAFVAAQSGTPAQAPGIVGQIPTADIGRQAEVLTVTGCLQRSETNAAASPNTPATSTATQATRTGGSFILTNASPSAPGAAAVSGAPAGSTGRATTAAGGRTGTASARAAGGSDATRNYTLIEKNTGELGPHLGHLMQISGVIASPAAGSSGDGANASATGSPNSATGGAAGRMGAMAGNPRLEVVAIRMIAATCPAPSTTR